MRAMVAGLLGLVAVSCSSEPSEIGTDFFSGGALDYAFTDTATVTLSTIQFERLQTSGRDRLLLGSHNDERLGRITASAFFEVTPVEWLNMEDDDVTYDYLALTLQYDRYHYYDTAAPLTLRVYEVTEEMEYEVIESLGTPVASALYADNAFEVGDDPLGTLTFLPRPNRGDSVEIRLSDALGLALFEKAKSGDEDLQSEAAFLRYLRGLAIIPDSSSSTAMLGFLKSAELRMYYKDRSITPVTQQYKVFKPGASSIVFTRIATNRSATPLQQLPSETERLPAAYTDDVAFMQAGGGLALRVDFPYLRELRQLSNFYVMTASLEMFPVRKSYNDLTPLPAALSVYSVNVDNTVYGTYPNKASLDVDADLGRETKYVLDVTDFVKAQMNLEEFNENGLLMYIDENYTVSADRIYAAERGQAYKTRLRIYFATVNKEQ